MTLDFTLLNAPADQVEADIVVVPVFESGALPAPAAAIFDLLADPGEAQGAGEAERGRVAGRDRGDEAVDIVGRLGVGQHPAGVADDSSRARGRQAQQNVAWRGS